jgi:hypothetical protein
MEYNQTAKSISARSPKIGAATLDLSPKISPYFIFEGSLPLSTFDNSVFLAAL